MRELSAAGMLDAWEASLRASAQERAAALLARAAGLDRDALAALPVGAHDALLLDLRERAFGGRMECETRCPACAERLEFALETATLRVPASAPEAGPQRLALDGVTVVFHVPTVADLAACAGAAAPDAAAQSLLARCIECTEPADATLDTARRTAVAERMAELDPQADLPIELVCAGCGHAWTEPFDAAAFLAVEVDGWARRTLDDVHLLAVQYGWSERDILALSPARRRYYVERAAL